MKYHIGSTSVSRVFLCSLLVVGVLAGGLACDGDPAQGGGGWTITPEAAGEHCVFGGIRIDGGEAPIYVCHGEPGSPGASPEVSAEPAGEHCAEGGLRVVAESGTFFLCHGASAPTSSVSFCEEGTGAEEALGARGGIVLSVDGIPGGATAPATADRPEVTGAILPLAACHRLWFPYDSGSGQVTGVQNHSPYALVTRVGPEMPGLVQALLGGSLISQATIFYDGLDALNDPITPLWVNLRDARVAVVQLFSHPDPRNPSRFGSFQRVDLTYGEIGWQEPGAAFEVTQDHFGQVVLDPGRPPCAPTAGSDVRQFMTVLTEGGDPLPGDADFPGEEGAVAVFGVCHSYYVPLVNGFAAGYRRNSPLALVKRTDPASTSVLQAFLTRALLPEVSIRYYAVLPGGGDSSEPFLQITLENASLLELSHTSHEGLRYEHLDLYYERVIWQQLPDGVSVSDDWGVDPG